MVVAKEKCVDFAKDKCFRPFIDAIIVVGKKKLARKLVGLVSMPERSSISKWVSLIGVNKCVYEITNKKASELLASDSRYEWFFEQR